MGWSIPGWVRIFTCYMLHGFWFNNKESQEEVNLAFYQHNFQLHRYLRIVSSESRARRDQGWGWGGANIICESITAAHTSHPPSEGLCLNPLWHLAACWALIDQSEGLDSFCGPMRGSCCEWSHNPIFRNDHDNPARSSPSFSPGSMQTRSQLNWNEYLAEALWRWDVSARELRFNWPLNPGWQVKSDCKDFYWLFLWPFCAIQCLKRFSL